MTSTKKAGHFLKLELKNYDLDCWGWMNSEQFTKRVNQMVEQARRFNTPGEEAGNGFKYLFRNVPTTEAGRRRLEIIQDRLRSEAGVEEFAVGLDEVRDLIAKELT